MRPRLKGEGKKKDTRKKREKENNSFTPQIAGSLRQIFLRLGEKEKEKKLLFALTRTT